MLMVSQLVSSWPGPPCLVNLVDLPIGFLKAFLVVSFNTRLKSAQLQVSLCVRNIKVLCVRFKSHVTSIFRRSFDS